MSTVSDPAWPSVLLHKKHRCKDFLALHPGFDDYDRSHMAPLKERTFLQLDRSESRRLRKSR